MWRLVYNFKFSAVRVGGTSLHAASPSGRSRAVCKPQAGANWNWEAEFLNETSTDLPRLPRKTWLRRETFARSNCLPPCKASFLDLRGPGQ